MEATQEKPAPYLSVREISRRTGVSEYSVRLWLSSRQLKGVRAGKFWRVTEEDLAKYLNRGSAA